MTHLSSEYWVETLENNVPKKVPHTRDGKKAFWLFISRSKAEAFHKELLENNPGIKFRLVKETTTWQSSPWIATVLKTETT